MSTFTSSTHNFLLMHGPTNKKAQVQNNCSDGATKQEIVDLAVKIFCILEPTSVIVQVWNKVYEEYADIEDDETVPGPNKIRVNIKQVQVFPVQLNSQMLETGTTSVISLLGGTQDSALETESFDVSEESMDTESDEGTILTEVRMTCDGAGEVMATTFEDSTDDEVVESTPPSTSLAARLLHFKMPEQPPAIEAKAKAGAHMSSPERSLFIDNIINAYEKVCKTRKTTAASYSVIMNQMFTKYPKMARPQPNLPMGNMRKLWKDRIIWRFQNTRKPSRCDPTRMPEVKNKNPRTAKPKPNHQPRREVTPQWGMACYLPDRPISEDDATIKKHEEFLIKEKSKRQPDFRLVKVAMDKTLADRREWLINTQPRPRIGEVKARYPWLFDEDQITTEMMRLQDSSTPLSVTFKEGLQKYSKALVTKGKTKKKPSKCFTDAMAEISVHHGETERQEAISKAAFLALPGLLQEKVEDIFVALETEVDNPVYLQLDNSDVLQCEVFSLMADGELVATSNSFLEAVVLWISSYYIFNLAYPARLQKTLAFVQKIILNILDELPTSRPIITLTNKLNIENARV